MAEDGIALGGDMGLTRRLITPRTSPRTGNEYYWINGRITWNNNVWVPQGTVVRCCIKCSLDAGGLQPTWEEAVTFGTVYNATGDFECGAIVLPDTALTAEAYCYAVDGGIILANGEVQNTGAGTTILNLVTAKQDTPIPPTPGGG